MIFVVGATGRLGGAIVQTLLAQGRSVRILVRQNSPSVELAKQGMATSADALIAAGAQAVVGDLKERASLDAACQGIRRRHRDSELRTARRRRQSTDRRCRRQPQLDRRGQGGRRKTVHLCIDVGRVAR